MRGKTMIRKAGLVLALSFALVLMMLLPNMRVEADGSMSWGEYTKKGDMNEKVGNAVTLKMGEKVSVTKGGKVTATYPYIMKFEGEAPYYEMTTGTGYLFTFDVAANKAVLVEPEMKNGGDSDKIKFLGYKISPDYDTLTWTDECYSGMAYGHDSQFVFLEKEEKLMLNSGSDFGGNGNTFVRINLACPRGMVEEGLRRLESGVRKRRTS